MSRSWLLLTVPLAAAALIGLLLTVRSLLLTVRNSVVASVPVMPEQLVRFDDAGEYALNVEGSAFSSAAGLGFAIAAPETRAPLPLHRIVMRTKTSSFSRTRLELYSFSVPAPGSYVLRVEGAQTASTSRATAIVFTRRFGVALVLHVLGLVLLGALVIGSIVGSAFAAGFANPAPR